MAALGLEALLQPRCGIKFDHLLLLIVIKFPPSFLTMPDSHHSVGCFGRQPLHQLREGLEGVIFLVLSLR
eukprot:44466-Karenia_brevis.AAC.1